MLAGKYFSTYTTGDYTAAAGTAFTAFVPPFGTGAQGGVPSPLYQVDGSGNPLWVRGTGAVKTQLVSLTYTVASPSAAQTVTVLRPLNFTYFTAAVAAGTTALPVAADPGVYSTNYKYSLPGGTGTGNGPSGPSNVADRVIAANDYVMYQLLDGTWVLDTVASGFSSGTITVTNGPPTPTVAGNGGCYKNGVLFHFGVAGVVDPATNQKQPAFTVAASANSLQLIGNTFAGGVAAMHYGDPLVLVCTNSGTAAGVLEEVTAAYMIH